MISFLKKKKLLRCISVSPMALYFIITELFFGYPLMLMGYSSGIYFELSQDFFVQWEYGRSTNRKIVIFANGF